MILEGQVQGLGREVLLLLAMGVLAVRRGQSGGQPGESILPASPALERWTQLGIPTPPTPGYSPVGLGEDWLTTPWGM